ncbi:MAG: hypothetical protein LBN27_04770 [Prevotellaceae bacterium]|jgi:hypothetical protein|nr:hypothetical protein [Prevotellaceae bacterium]
MNRFIKKAVLFFAPLTLLFASITVCYFILDPFRVLYTYDFNNERPIAQLNGDFVSTEMFLKMNPKYHYNSFIFGSSRTLAYLPDHWKDYLSNNYSIFRFNAPGENIYGIYTKIKYLDNNNIPIKNALIILCRNCSFSDKNYTGHLLRKHPLTSQENRLFFQLEFFKVFFNRDFLMCYFDMLINKQYKSYMENYLNDSRFEVGCPDDNSTNTMLLTGREKMIMDNPKKYYADLKFPQRTGEKNDSVSRINEKQKMMLYEIKKILDKHNTEYRVVISPLYEQIKLNPKDKKILDDCFGENMYDFSGKNKFSEDRINFYEWSHYRPLVGDSIMSEIYRPNIDSL